MNKRFAASVLAFVLALATGGVLATGAARDYQVGDRLAAPADDGAAKGAQGQGRNGQAGFREITWDDLMPADWLPEDLFDGLFDDADPEGLSDFDPKAVEMMNKIREIWDSAPVVEALEGQRVRLPGFVVPLEADEQEIREFLLVPYFGACIHVPPPPANQLIHVVPDKPVKASLNMMPVWVNGVIGLERLDSGMGVSGYRMRGIGVEAYEE